MPARPHKSCAGIAESGAAAVRSLAPVRQPVLGAGGADAVGILKDMRLELLEPAHGGRSHVPGGRGARRHHVGRRAGLGEDPVDALVGADVLAQRGDVDVAQDRGVEGVPTGLGRGSRVDVWVIGEDRGSRSEAELVLEDVLVVDAPVVSDSFASATVRQLVLAVPRDDEESLGVVLAASGDGVADCSIAGCDRVLGKANAMIASLETGLPRKLPPVAVITTNCVPLLPR